MPLERRVECFRENPTMHKWQLFGPFVSRKEAKTWERLQEDCIAAEDGEELDSPAGQWWGYRYEY
jgi:hypothetical protein